jgi:hypothetical protein
MVGQLEEFNTPLIATQPSNTENDQMINGARVSRYFVAKLLLGWGSKDVGNGKP